MSPPSNKSRSTNTISKFYLRLPISINNNALRLLTFIATRN